MDFCKNAWKRADFEKLRAFLKESADERYREFHSSLLPDTDNVLGVRLPRLRELAKQISRGNVEEYLRGAQCDFYEEDMLFCLVAAYSRCDVQTKLRRIELALPHIKNWAVCDSMCNTLKPKGELSEPLFLKVKQYVMSEREFTARFGVVMLLCHYISRDTADLLCEVSHDGYYVKMAVAWAVQVLFVKDEDAAMSLLKSGKLDDFTQNKAISKIRDSFRVDRETKDKLLTLRR